MDRRERVSRRVGGWIAVVLMALGTVFLTIGIVTQERGFAAATLLFLLGFVVFFYFLFRASPERYKHPTSHVKSPTYQQESH
ncbi:hypothetical protein [Microbacterium maritypicum]|uniref:hypothetical protein n=1 Tax=Microbacterium maritypicum TaxID=33918 RepID=UPI00382A8E60